MNFSYTDKTLFININERLQKKAITKLKRHLFKLIDDYEIDSIILDVKNKYENNACLDTFIHEYSKQCEQNLKIR